TRRSSVVVAGQYWSAEAARVGSGIEGTSGLPAQSGHHPGSGERHERHLDGDAGLEAHGGPGGDVEPFAPGRRTVEVQAGIGLGEVVVGTDLDGAVGGVEDGEAGDLAALVVCDRVLGVEDLSGNHG